MICPDGCHFRIKGDKAFFVHPAWLQGKDDDDSDPRRMLAAI
jgi:hypothetical protein